MPLVRNRPAILHFRQNMLSLFYIKNFAAAEPPGAAKRTTEKHHVFLQSGTADLRMAHPSGRPPDAESPPVDRRAPRPFQAHEAGDRPRRPHRMAPRGVARRIRAGAPYPRTTAPRTPRIQDSAHLLLALGLRNPQELQRGRLHLLPAHRHAAQRPALP